MMAATRHRRLDRLAHARGVDWFPSWARCNVDYFTAAMPVETARRELRFVQGLGFDHVRIWLNARGHEADPAGYVSNLTLLLDAAHELGLGVVLELFDSCGIEPSRGAGDTVRIEDVPRLGAGAPSLDAVDSIGAGRGRDLFVAPALVEVLWRGDASVAVWEGFVPNPGYDWLAPQHWPRWDAYATDVIRAVHHHPALLLLEVMNEPFITHLGHEVDRQPIVDFYRHVIELARDLDPALPLAIGAAQPFIADHDANAPDLDVISFHSLAGPQALRDAVAEATRVAAGRPVYCSEWGYFPGGTDEQQLRELQQLLPILDEAGIGWAVTHLIAGYGPFANTALLYPSGVMRPGAVWLREQLQVGAEPQGATA